MHIFDHMYLLLLFVVQPVFGTLAFRRFLASGRQPDRVRLYRKTFLLEWIACAILVSAWYALGRAAGDLGFVAPRGIGFWGGVVVLVALVAFLTFSWRNAKEMSEADRSKQAAALGKLVHLLPRTDRDFRYFVFLSITAGVVEEILYRGFVLWYLTLYMPLWAAVLVSSAAFGLGHSYQGAAGAVRTGLVGLAFAIFYILTGSIWLPIVAHIAVDVLQGATIREILRRPPGSTEPRDVRV